MLEWMEEGDRMSFDDSDRFEEDSLCSWGSEPESLCNNWRGWKKPLAVSTTQGTPLLASNQRRAEDGSVLSLAELCSRVVAAHIAFEVVEQAWQPVPEPLQLRIAFWSFPDNEEDIRLYSCLANGAADEFNKGENLYKSRAVKEPLQIGFHLSASVVSPQQTAQGKLSTFNVAVTFDRRRITSCNCTCASRAFWCAHVVAVCLYRIHQSHLVTLRAPVSESLSRLQRDQLQKFAQYLISELPQQILPTAQRLLDELLSAQPSAINTVCGAPDPTAGASASEQTSWCLDENTLHENIRKILIKFCVPSPTVFSDVNYLSSTAPPAAAEWSSLLRPLRGREPEGMWNLLSIVREMFKRHDRNAVPLLEVLTEEIMSCEQIMVWWFNTKVAMHNGSAGGYGNGMKTSNLGSQSQASQHACSSLCDEVVILWRLAALNPGLSSEERELLRQQFSEWHVKVIDKVSKSKGVNSHGGMAGGPSTPRRTSHSFRIEIEVFTGFKSSIEACYLSWDDYPVPGVTYTQGHRLYHCPFTCFRHSETHGRIDLGQINASSAVIKNDLPVHMLQRRVVQGEYGLMLEEMQQQRESGAHHHNNNKNNGFPTSPTLRPERELDRAGNRSSVSSEGFCENEGDPAAEVTFEPSAMPMPSGLRDLVRQDSDDPALGSDTNEPEVLAADSCNSTDKDNKSSPEDFDADSDWSGVDARLKLGRIAAGAAMEASTSATVEPQPGPSSLNIGEASYASAGPSSAPIQVAQVIREPCVLTVPNRGSFGEIKPLEDPLEILFARAEGLHAHGHSAEACELGVQLASELLANPPDLLVELPPIIAKNGKKKKTNPACHQISCIASATLAKCAFLCTVLAENLDYYHLAFRVGMFGLELARPPATTKPLEVKLSHQESELVTLLKRIPLGHSELTILREKAEQLRDGILRSRGDALLPLSLATFIFEALVTTPGIPQQARSSHYTTHRLPTDETLGFEAAVAALGLKANVSEADHPLLCEGTRRQRGDLAGMLLVHYKDDPDKLAKIMDKLLDRQVHPLYKAPLLSSFYTNNPTPMGYHNSASANTRHSNQMRQRREGGLDAGIAALALDSGNSASSREANSAHPGGATGGLREQSPTWEEDYAHWQSGHSTGNEAQQAEAANHGAGASGGVGATGGACNRHLMSVARNRGMAHRNQRQSTGPGSDSGSSGSGKSSGSDSFGSRGPMSYPPPSCSGGAVASTAAGGASFSDDRLSNLASHSSPASSGQHHAQHHQAIPEMGAGSNSSSSTFNRNGSTGSLGSVGASGVSGGGGLGNGKVNQRFKNKRLYPSVPNQPSEASAHFMFELAKTVLLKAGGNSSTSLFTQPINSQNPRGPIRALQMCAFQIGLYALGLHNCVSAKWLSRTYSSHVSWITGQAMEIGSQALWFLISTWEGHLTPPEVASIADRASRGHEANMVRAAAELALSCLPHAHALNPNEIQRAILQCKEQSSEMLERACLAVESAAKGGGVYPEVLFCVARCWHELYEQRMPSARRGGAARLLPSVEQPPPPIPMQVPPCPMQQPQANMAGVGVPVPYPMASIVPFPLAYSFLSGTAPGPNPPAQISGVPVYLPAPAGAAGAGPNATFSYAPPIPGLQYFSSVTCPMPMGPTSGPPNPPPGPSPLMPMPSQGGNSSRPPPSMAPPGCQVSLQPLLHSSNNPTHQGPPSLYAQQPPQQPPPPTPQQQQQMQQPQLNSIRTPPSAPGPMPNQALTPVQLQLLLAAYRVGIVALETLGRRAHDDRPQARYSRNPPYGEDVKWLLSVAKKLGTEHLQQFCVVTVTSVVSPFVLHEIAVEAAHFFAYTGSGPPNPYMQHLRSRVLTPLIQKCHQMYIQCVNHKLYHLNSNDYDDFLSIVQAARSAFHLIPTGPMQFNEFLQSIQKSKSCTKELWGRLMAIVRQPAV